METMWLVLFVVSMVATVVFVCKAVWSLIRRTRKVKRNLLFALLSFILILVSSVSYASIFAKEALNKNNTASSKKESLNSEEKMTKEEKELSKTKADQEPFVAEAKPKEEPKKEEKKAKPVVKEVNEKDLNTEEAARWRVTIDRKIGRSTGDALNNLKYNLSLLTTYPEMVNSQDWQKEVRMDITILKEVDTDLKLEVKEVPNVYKEAHNKILEGFKEFNYVTTNLEQATKDNRPVSENKLLMKCIEHLNKGDAKIQEAVDIVNNLDESVNKEG